MRKDTIYDNMQRIYREERDFQSKFLTFVLGQTVLTEFNNRTYRIDDVDFSQSPKNTFQSKNGPITFLEYYQTRYNITIRDVNQPLLVVKPSARDIRGGRSEPILLIPELCRSTGLTETMRSNFRQVHFFFLLENKIYSYRRIFHVLFASFSPHKKKSDHITLGIDPITLQTTTTN